MINGSTLAAPNVNLELTKHLRALLAAAERGQVGSLIIIGCGPDGQMIKAATVSPAHLFVLYAGLGNMMHKIDLQIVALEQPGAPSAIQRATGMPGEA